MEVGHSDADDDDVTDVPGLLGNWRAVLTGCLAVLTVAVVTVVVRTGDPSTADTFLVHAVNAAVVLPDGRTVDAAPGLAVPAGAQVRTGSCGTAAQPRTCGAAQLRTDDRDVYLGAASTLLVTDGVRQSLDKGLAMVDSRRGPRLALTTRAGTVAVDGDSLVRVELGTLLMRVGAFQGRAHLSAVGRQARTDVPTLHQVRAPYVGLPGPATALSLTGDAWEEKLAADLVAADRDLVRLAAGLAGGQGRTVLTLAPAALRTVVAATGPVFPAAVGENALAVAVAQAGSSDGSAVDRLDRVRDARAEGGSWGVVAALVEARVSSVSGVLDGWLTVPGESVPVGAVTEPDLAGFFGGTPRPTPGPSSSRGPGSPGPSATPSRTPSASTAPTTASPTPGTDLVTTITGLLSPPPTPSAGPSSSSSLDLGILRGR